MMVLGSAGLQGVLTPFDNLSGFERKVHAPSGPSAAQQRTAGQASTSGVTCCAKHSGLMHQHEAGRCAAAC